MFLLLLILMITVTNYLIANKTDLRLSETHAKIQKLLGSPPPSSSSISNDVLQEYSIRSQKDILESVPRGINQEFYQQVKPEAICKEKVRIGEVSDGGKYVCKPTAVTEECTIMSLGLNNQIGFDEHIAKVTGGKCKILGADLNEQSAALKKKYTAINGQLFVGRIPDEIALPEMMKKAGKTSVDLLKIDIEGGEVTGLEPLLKEFPVCQIFIELHGIPRVQFKMLQVMAKYNFRIFNIDPNYRCSLCCEYSLIHESCMEQYGVIPLAITIPKEPLDDKDVFDN